MTRVQLITATPSQAQVTPIVEDPELKELLQILQQSRLSWTDMLLSRWGDATVSSARRNILAIDKLTFSLKLMVFCVIKRDGTFELKFYKNKTMDGGTYHSLLQ